MPNHTDNHVVLSHTNKIAVDRIESVLKTEDAKLLHSIIPMPEDANWYDWRIENWGTKWDIYDVSWTRIDDNTISLHFDTAWSPPVPVFEELVTMGFDIDARYFDEGWGYIGQFYAQDGKIDDYCRSDIEEAIKQLPELDETFGVSEQLAEMEMEIA